MNNISFANPYLLLLLIPLLLVCLIPYFIAVRKDNRTINHILSLIIHIITTILVTFVIAGFTYELVMTETNIYVLADVSYSSENNLDKIDEYIERLNKNVPKNSKIGVVGFARDYEIITELGEKFETVKDNTLDRSATNINEALSYTGSLFKNDVLKRIVLITDGRETTKSNIVGVVDSLSKNDILVDAIYLDNNLKEETPEIQISQIEYSSSTYINKDEHLSIMIDSNKASKGVITLTGNGEELNQAYSVRPGLNVVDLKLNTKVAGSFDYKITLKPVGEEFDTSKYNNTYLFHQDITDIVNVLFIGHDYREKQTLDKLYPTDSTRYKVTSYNGKREVPYTLEELCKYDEIVLSNIDVRTLNNSTQFIDSLNKAVSEYGKRLLTVGNTFVQMDDNGDLTELSKMLPVNYGNNQDEGKSVVIVLDISKSLMEASREKIAKEAACAILDLLKKNDEVAVLGFYGSTITLEPMNKPQNINALKEKILNVGLGQGTYIGTALEQAISILKDRTKESKQVMLISDGINSLDSNQLTLDECANLMLENGIVMNTICANNEDKLFTLKELAAKAGGKGYLIKEPDEVRDIVFTEVADSILENELEENFAVELSTKKDEALEGVSKLPNIKGIYYNKKKNHTNVLASVKYKKPTGQIINIPLYTTWKYGNGEVHSLSTSISSNKMWGSSWDSDYNAGIFLSNLKERLIPDERIKTPYNFNIILNGNDALIKVNGPAQRVGDEVSVSLKGPDGNTQNLALSYNGSEYVARIKATEVGRYDIHLNYQNGTIKHEADKVFNISYQDEYNSFLSFDSGSLYYMVSEGGIVSEDGNLKIENDLDNVESYSYDLTIIFMSVAVSLFVLDICIRKLRISDIKSFFKIKRRKA